MLSENILLSIFNNKKLFSIFNNRKWFCFFIMKHVFMFFFFFLKNKNYFLEELPNRSLCSFLMISTSFFLSPNCQNCMTFIAGRIITKPYPVFSFSLIENIRSLRTKQVLMVFPYDFNQFFLSPNCQNCMTFIAGRIITKPYPVFSFSLIENIRSLRNHYNQC